MLCVEFPAFTKALIRLPNDDYAVFQRELVTDPDQETSFGAQAAFARPVWPSRVRLLESGKARVIYPYLANPQIIVLVTLYAKAKKSDLSRTEENELRAA